MRPLVLVFVTLLNFSAFAGIQLSDTKESLRGLKGVFVISQIVDTQPKGLSTNGIQQMLERVLREAGIQVDAKPENAHGDANLSITVNVVKDTQLDLYLFMVQMAVVQRAQLIRQPHAQPLAAQTWTRNIQGLTPPDRIDVIEQAIKTCASAFVDDYWKVNPRPKQ